MKKQHDFIEKNIQGSKMFLDLNDNGISKDLALDGIREPVSTKIMQELVRQSETFFDIGANIGYYALMESRLVGDNGKVYCIEPSPSNYDRLISNIKLNGYTNTECFMLGIGDKIGKADMYISPHSNLNSLVPQGNKPTLGKIKINLTTFDKFVKDKKKPDWVRIDVEGYEYYIIKGMQETLKSKQLMKIFIELHPHIMKKEQTLFVLNTLMKNGFEIKKCTRCFTTSEMKVKSKDDWDYSFMTIKSMINDVDITTGKKGAFEIFFERR